ncbi:DUF4118 domain-containing protein [Sphingomonas sediminicola]|uniref:DUF4118 domain-containing protein n=1 Tax=Sphingomonas sediminicola TaxID=386874 RepID=A0ABX6TC24_9SPHN|nr:DUF4118 domain-containing protein [Sphingomonas sediminicola]
MVWVRAQLEPIANDRAPYALNFLAVVTAAMLAGWRSGLVALVVGQLLIWYAIVPPAWSFSIPDAERAGGLIIATFSQLLVLLVIGLYQREVDKGTAERERRMELLNHALNEIDHRTRNNHQTVLALVQLQAQRSSDDNVRAALHQVADRIQAIAHASERLALRSGTSSTSGWTTTFAACASKSNADFPGSTSTSAATSRRSRPAPTRQSRLPSSLMNSSRTPSNTRSMAAMRVRSS